MKKRKGADQLLAVALSASMVVSMNAPVAAWAETGEEGSATPGSQVVEVEPVESVGEQTAEPVAEPSEAVGAAKVKEAPAEFAARGVSNTTAVAMIGGTSYGTLQGAIDAVTSTETVTLVSDVQLSEGVDTLVVSGAEKSVALDLNGCTITAAGNTSATVTEGAKLTVKDSSEGKAGAIRFASNGFKVIGNTEYTDGSQPDPSKAVFSTLTLESGTITTNSGSAAAVFPYGNGATFNMTDGAVENTYKNGTTDGGFAIAGNGTRKAGQDYGGIAINISDGTVRSAQDCAMYLPGYCDVNVTGGVIEGWSGIEIDSGNLSIGGTAVVKSTHVGNGDRNYKTSGDGNYNFGAALAIVSKGSQAATGYYGHMNIAITGGTLESTSYYAIDEYNLAHMQNEGNQSVAYIDSFSIKGGTIKGKGGAIEGSTGAVLSDNMKGFITDGTYSSDPTAYLAQGYKAQATADGMWKVAAAAVAKVGDVEYTSLQAAINAATNDQTISLIADVSADSADLETENWHTVRGKTISLDLAGHSVTLDQKSVVKNKNSKSAFYVAEDAGLTVLDSSDGKLGKITTTAPEGENGWTTKALIYCDGSFELQSGTVKGAENVYYLLGAFGPKSHVTISDGLVDNQWGAWDNGGIAIAANGKKVHEGYQIDITGGTIKGGEQALYLPSAGTVNVSGGTLVGTGRGIEVRAGSLTISGGSISASQARVADAVANNGGSGSYTGALVVVNPKDATAEGYAGDVNVQVTGGTFKNASGDAVALINEQKIDANPYYKVNMDVSAGDFTGGLNVATLGEGEGLSLTGGTYTTAQMPAGCVADGYLAEPNADKTAYTVSSVAQSGNKVQIVDENGNATGVAQSVSEAVKDVQGTGGSLVLAGNVDEPTGITVPEVSAGTVAKPVTIELNGNNVTASGTDAAVTVGAGADLVISDAKGSGVISSTSAQAPAVEVAGTVTLDGATVKSESSDGIKVAPGATLTVKSGVVEAKVAPKVELRSARAAAPGQYGISAVGESGKTTTLNIEGGKISGAAGALSIGEGVNCTVTGGVFNSDVSEHVDSTNYRQDSANGLYYIAPNVVDAYNVAQFKGNAADSSTWTAPIAPAGKAFAGWYTDGTYATPSTAIEGTVYAKFVEVSSVVEFKGGSLRIDPTPETEGSIRFGYTLRLPDDSELVGAKWVCTVNGKEYEYTATNFATYDTGRMDVNLVLEKALKANYGTEVSTIMNTTYKTVDGTTVTIKDNARNRSINQVAQYILNSSTASADEKAYANKILA